MAQNSPSKWFSLASSWRTFQKRQRHHELKLKGPLGEKIEALMDPQKSSERKRLKYFPPTLNGPLKSSFTQKEAS